MREDFSVSFAEEPAPKKPTVLQVGPHRLTFRRFDFFPDYSTTRSEIGKHARECPGYLALAMLGVVKRQGVKEEASDLERVIRQFPAAHPMGMLLWQSAQSLAERRAESKRRRQSGDIGPG